MRDLGKVLSVSPKAGGYGHYSNHVWVEIEYANGEKQKAYMHPSQLQLENVIRELIETHKVPLEVIEKLEDAIDEHVSWELNDFEFNQND